MLKLNQKIETALSTLKISKYELSRRLGKSVNYLGEMQRVGCSTEKQNEIISMIDEVLKGERFKSDDEIIADLSEKLEKSQQTSQHNADCAHKYLNMVHERDKTINELKKSNIDLMHESDGYHNANNELNAELNELRKTAQNRAEELEKANYTIKRLGDENNQIRATRDNYEHELTEAGKELIEQDAVIDELNEKIDGLTAQLSETNKVKRSYMAAFFMLISLVIICLAWSAFK